MPPRARAAFEGGEVGPGALGFAVARVAGVDAPFPAEVNPAGFFRSPGTRFDAFGTDRFGLPALRRIRIGLSGARERLLWSIGAGRFGGEPYREETLAAGVGAGLTARTRLGASVRLLRLRIAGHGSAAAAAIDAGLASRPTRDLRIGVVWRALNRPRLGVSRVPLPSALIVGVEGSVGGRVTWTVEGRRPDSGPGDIGIGFVFGVIRGVRIGVGVCGETGEYGLGTEFDPPHLRIGYAVSMHPALGTTHSVSISFGRGAGGGRSP